MTKPRKINTTRETFAVPLWFFRDGSVGLHRVRKKIVESVLASRYFRSRLRIPPTPPAFVRPRKLAFGHGHPVTSGSPGIDYFVSSELFETALSTDAREVRRIAGTASDISQAAAAAAARALEAAETAYTTTSDEEGIDDGPNHVSSATAYALATGSDRRQPGPQRGLQTTTSNGGEAGGNGDGGNAEQDYTEQLVLFDSLTASLPEVFGPPNAPSGRAAVLAAVRESSSTQGSLTEGHHWYHCIQHSKKFHPGFDPVLRGILESDLAAKILLTTGSKVCSPVQSTTIIGSFTKAVVPWHLVEVQFALLPRTI